MKRIGLIIICFVCITLSVNAQWYRSGSRAGNRMAHYAHSMKLTSMQLNSRRATYHYNSYNQTNYDTNYDTNSGKWLDYFVCFGFGIGGGTLNPTGNLTHSSFDMDLICMNVLMTLKLGSFEDTGYGYNVSSSDATSLQFGVLIPVIGFGKDNFWGRKHKAQIFVAPLIGFINSEDVKYDGSFLHDKTPSEQYGHICHYWISDNKETDTSCTEYGGALMVRYGCGYLLGKFTNKSLGVSVGFCY